MRLPWRTRAFCWVVDALAGPPLSRKTLAQIRRNRALQPVHVFPFDRVFGRVPRGVTWRDEPARTRAGSVRVRVYQPPARTSPAGTGGRGAPLVLFFHGGGWVQGGLRGYDAVCAQVAAGAGAVRVLDGAVDLCQGPFGHVREPDDGVQAGEQVAVDRDVLAQRLDLEAVRRLRAARGDQRERRPPDEYDGEEDGDLQRKVRPRRKSDPSCCH